MNYLVRLARSSNPVKAHRSAIVRLVVFYILIAVTGVVVNWPSDARAISPLRLLPSAFELGVYCFVTLVVVLGVAAYSLTRLRREHYLVRKSGQKVWSAYLVPDLAGFIDRQMGTKVYPAADSVSVVVTPSAIEFWIGGANPSRLAAIQFAEIASVRFVQDGEHFLRTEIKIKHDFIPLYAVVRCLGLSQKSSKSLFELISAASTLIEA